MKVEIDRKLKIKIKGSDADTLKSALNKISEEQKTIGFKNSTLNENEINIIQSLSNKINDC